MDWKKDPTYYGKILTGPYSALLKKRVEACITGSRHFEILENPAICYIAAWHEKDRIIWYEFVGRRLSELLNCAPGQVAKVFRDSVTERRVYRQRAEEPGIKKEIIQQPELTSFRRQLREEVKKTGMIEAVYRLVLGDGRVIWLKDQAEIERYPEDRTSLSLGCLTEVTKEMEAAEERERLVAELQEALSKVKQLSGLLPICASCKKIRDDRGYWNQIEEYIRKHSEADFSHGFCPACLEKLYPDLALAMSRAKGEKGGLDEPGRADQGFLDPNENEKD